MLNNRKGFTLIELLIVIVIIGILAGVLIAVIDPAKQQNRAKDAGVQATMNKVALAAEGFVSAYGRAPNDVELIGSLQNATPAATGVTCVGNDGACNFSVTGNTLISKCGATGWTGDDTTTGQCMFHYYSEFGGAEPTHFRVVAKSFGIANTVFLYDNKAGSIIECPASGTGMVADTTNTGCN